MIQVFLTENVPGLGKKGETKMVKSAYAQNYLFPRGLAVLPCDLKATAFIEAKTAKNLAQKTSMAQKEAVINALEGQKFIIQSKADKNGHLYGSIGPKEIAKAVGVEQNLITAHFKQIGVFPLELRVGQAQAKIEIEIKNN